jgi:NAD(P)H dehydrogenase (quinone)
MSKPTIFIAGATGKSGFVAVKYLLNKGFKVKAMARGKSQKTDELENLGAEVVFGNLLDITSVEVALQGVQRAYFVYPPEDGLLEATINFVMAAKLNGVEAIVNMSQMQVRKNHGSPLTRLHWLGEQVLNQSGLIVTHICPGFFSEMIYLMNGQSILTEGKMYLPHANEYHGPIASEDIGKCVAAILEDPKKHDGKRYLLSGPERLSQSEIATIASEVLGIEIDYVAISVEEWSSAVRSSGLMSDFLIKHLAEVGFDYQNGLLDEVNSNVESLTGKKAQNMKTFLENNKGCFTSDFLHEYAEKLAKELNLAA